ncbi:MAG TPA: pyridoxal-dependent decarboxylase [Acidimicrobiales bacterium]|nr:pyridoxal-dependent decarboxylase [Acidimicrobiales bacterium]
MTNFPYDDRFAVHRTFPEQGAPRDEVLAELRTMATEEDAFWETGKCSGTMYCGDHDHYRFLTDAFGLFAHVNVLQRDMCPSATKFEAEIVAMTLDLLHGEAAHNEVGHNEVGHGEGVHGEGGAGADGTPAAGAGGHEGAAGHDGAAGHEGPVGMVTTGGSGSISHAMLAYREHAAQTRGVDRPNVVKPETAHPAFDKACHLFGIELRRAPVDPVTTEVDVDWVADHVDDRTVAIVGSACNYGYGTVDPIGALSDVAVERGVGLHVDGCLGGFILPFGQELGYEVPVFDYRLPGVTSISADTHKYGYALKGTSVLTFRHKALRNAQYFTLTDWSGGKYCSPGMEGSRSGGLLAATWAAMVQLGREGYRRYAQDIFHTSLAMQEAVRSHPELRIIGRPTFLFSFTSDDFDVYHVNDFMRARGWRFNGQQYPNALHMAVTRPQTQPGVTEAFAADLADGVAYAKAHRDDAPRSGAVYGGVAGGMTAAADELIKAVMADMMDAQQAVPFGPRPSQP